MREILFRGKQSVNIVGKENTGEMQIGNLVYSIGRHPMIEVFGETRSQDRSYAVIPETVGQFIGLTDMDGNKIFEGDILKVKSRWKNTKEGFTFWSVEYAERFTDKGNGFYVYGIDRRWSKPITGTVIFNAKAIIVGNIYENAELLKGGAK